MSSAAFASYGSFSSSLSDFHWAPRIRAMSVMLASGFSSLHWGRISAEKSMKVVLGCFLPARGETCRDV